MILMSIITKSSTFIVTSLQKSFIKSHIRQLSTSLSSKSPSIVIIGGGPSGYFTSISLLSPSHPSSPSCKILESTSSPLRKVLLSGGGRCNLLPDVHLPTSVLLKGYPIGRGRKELLSPTSQKGGVEPSAVLRWFNDNGVDTKVEDDGRMFPVTDDSSTVAEALDRARLDLGVEVVEGFMVEGVERKGRW